MRGVIISGVDIIRVTVFILKSYKNIIIQSLLGHPHRCCSDMLRSAWLGNKWIKKKNFNMYFQLYKVQILIEGGLPMIVHTG